MRLVTTSQSCSERGLGLVEAVVSSGLVIVLALGLTQLVAMSTASVSTVARETTALLAAVQKMEQLQGFSWGSPALRLSPVDSLTRDTAGYVDFLDRHGVSVGSGINPPTGASLVRRWSVRPRGSSVRNDGGLVLSVVVALMQRVERSPLPPLGSVEAGRRLVVHAQNVAGDASGGTMSLTEIVLALMLTSVVVGTTLQLVDPVRDVLGVQTHTSELHQRVRTGFERFHRDLVNAGLAVSNPGAGHYPLVAVVPGRIGGRPLNGRGNASSADDALTLLSTDVGAADVSTVSSLQNANTSVQITCVMSAAACGLRPDTTILIADTLGRSGLLRVTRVTGSVLTVVPLAGRQFSYGPGASIRPVSVRSYYHDEGRIQVRVEDGWRTDSPFLDGVVLQGSPFDTSARRTRSRRELAVLADPFCQTQP